MAVGGWGGWGGAAGAPPNKRLIALEELCRRLVGGREGERERERERGIEDNSMRKGDSQKARVRHVTHRSEEWVRGLATHRYFVSFSILMDPKARQSEPVRESMLITGAPEPEEVYFQNW